jgi:serine/threonine-protein kinase
VVGIGVGFGATWGSDGTIVFADTHKLRGLQRVSADGGQPTVITRPNPQAGEADHVWPEFLPGGKAVLFTISSASGQLGDAQIAVLDLRTDKYKSVLRSGSHAHYVKTGHLVYGASGTLRAIRFDLDRLETVGTPVPVLSQVVTTADGAADFDISEDGTLAYVTGGVQSMARSLVWVDRQGREEPLKAPFRGFLYPRLSPDGSRIALDIRDQDNDIWIWDIARETLMRLTRDPATEAFPLWMPDGRHLLYSSDATGSPNLYSQLADPNAQAERLTHSPANQFAHSVTRDGGLLIFSESTPEIRRSLKMLSFDSPQQSQTLVQTPFTAQNGALSPNERWLAYESNETGEFEVYVRPFPGLNGGGQISTSGGLQPVWRRDSAELFFWDKRGQLMSVTIRQGPDWAAGVPTKILEPRYFRSNDHAAPTYDVSPDGRRFLVIKPLPASNENANPMSLVVAQNWFEELKRLFAGK